MKVEYVTRPRVYGSLGPSEGTEKYALRRALHTSPDEGATSMRLRLRRAQAHVYIYIYVPMLLTYTSIEYICTHNGYPAMPL